MTTRAVHLLAIFILIYVGVEVTIGGKALIVAIRSMITSFHFICVHTLLIHLLSLLMLGWIVTFIIDVRGGGPSSGYISAGFFGGKKWVFRVTSPKSFSCIFDS